MTGIYSLLVTMPPGLLLMVGGILVPFFTQKLRGVATMLLPLITLIYIWEMPLDEDIFIHLAGFEMNLVHQHPFSRMFATIFTLMIWVAALFAMPRYATGNTRLGRLELGAAMMYAGSAVGMTFAGDFISMFLYLEVMAVTGSIIVACGGTEKARRSAVRYATMHLLSGILFFEGIASHILLNGNTSTEQFDIDWVNIATLGADTSMQLIAALLMMLGILINTGAPPFSRWISDSYPEASPFGTVYLSAFTTKASVFLLLTLFSGSDVLIYLGLFMIMYGILYALLENDIRRILSYSIVNQVGFMMVGIGIGTAIAQAGTATHAFSHIMYKALLLMSAGSVVYMTGKNKCSEVGGLHHTMKLTMVCGIIGAAAISSFPFTAGYTSKLLIAEGAAQQHMAFVWLMLAAATAGVCLHAGIKFPWFVFFQKDSGLRPKEPPFPMKLAMIIVSIGCILPGVFPWMLYDMLPYEVTYDPYQPGILVTHTQLILFGGVAFFVLLPLMKRTDTISLDMDWLYRVFLLNLLELFERFLMTIHWVATSFGKMVFAQVQRLAFEHAGPDGVMARNLGTGITVLFAAVILAVYLLLYFLSN